MLISRGARRYALAIYDEIPADSTRGEIFAQLDDLHTTFHSSRELQHFFASPIIPFSKKRDVIEVLFKDRVGVFVHRLLVFLLEKRREGLVHEIIEALFDLDRAHRNITSVDVHSSHEFSTAQRKQLESKLAVLTGGGVETVYHTQSDLIGGAIVRVGDVVYDGSVLRQLERLRARFITGVA